MNVGVLGENNSFNPASGANLPDCPLTTLVEDIFRLPLPGNL